jgi:hypothetical protein
VAPQRHARHAAPDFCIPGAAARQRGMMPVKITRTPLWEWVRGAAEYDALYRARGPLSAVSLDELLAMSIPAAQPRQPDQSAAGELVASGNASVPPRAGSLAADGSAAPAYRPRGRWLSWIVVLGLLVVVGFGVYSRLSGPRHAAAVPPAAGKRAVTHQPARPGTPAPAPKLTHAAATPTPAPQPTRAATTPAAAPAQTLAPAGAVEPGPGGGSTPPAQGATGSSGATGGSGATAPARRLVHHRPLPEPVPQQEPAPEPAQTGHDHGRLDHHRRRAPADQQATVGSRQLPGTRYDARPGRYA